MSATMDCVHCSTAFEIPLSTIDGREDYWLCEGQRITCKSCGGVNVVQVNSDDEAWFAGCDDEACAACAAEDAKEQREAYVRAHAGSADK